MPSMTRAQKAESARKRKKAIDMGNQDSGVTDVELAESVQTKAIGAMAAMLSRLGKAGHMVVTQQRRGDRPVWRTTPGGSAHYALIEVESSGLPPERIATILSESTRTLSRIGANNPSSPGAKDIVQGARLIITGVEQLLDAINNRGSDVPSA